MAIHSRAPRSAALGGTLLTALLWLNPAAKAEDCGDYQGIVRHAEQRDREASLSLGEMNSAAEAAEIAFQNARQQVPAAEAALRLCEQSESKGFGASKGRDCSAERTALSSARSDLVGAQFDLDFAKSQERSAYANSQNVQAYLTGARSNWEACKQREAKAKPAKPPAPKPTDVAKKPPESIPPMPAPATPPPTLIDPDTITIINPPPPPPPPPTPVATPLGPPPPIVWPPLRGPDGGLMCKYKAPGGQEWSFVTYDQSITTCPVIFPGHKPVNPDGTFTGPRPDDMLQDPPRPGRTPPGRTPGTTVVSVPPMGPPPNPFDPAGGSGSGGGFGPGSGSATGGGLGPGASGYPPSMGAPVPPFGLPGSGSPGAGGMSPGGAAGGGGLNCNYRGGISFTVYDRSCPQIDGRPPMSSTPSGPPPDMLRDPPPPKTASTPGTGTSPSVPTTPAATGPSCPAPTKSARKCPWTPDGFSVGECGPGFCWDGGPRGTLACKQEKDVANSKRTDLSDIWCNDGLTAVRDQCTGELLRCEPQRAQQAPPSRPSAAMSRVIPAAPPPPAYVPVAPYPPPVFIPPYVPPTRVGLPPMGPTDHSKKRAPPTDHGKKRLPMPPTDHGKKRPPGTMTDHGKKQPPGPAMGPHDKNKPLPTPGAQQAKARQGLPRPDISRVQPGKRLPGAQSPQRAAPATPRSRNPAARDHRRVPQQQARQQRQLRQQQQQVRRQHQQRQSQARRVQQQRQPRQVRANRAARPAAHRPQRSGHRRR